MGLVPSTVVAIFVGLIAVFAMVIILMRIPALAETIKRILIGRSYIIGGDKIPEDGDAWTENKSYDFFWGAEITPGSWKDWRDDNIVGDGACRGRNYTYISGNVYCGVFALSYALGDGLLLDYDKLHFAINPSTDINKLVVIFATDDYVDINTWNRPSGLRCEIGKIRGEGTWTRIDVDLKTECVGALGITVKTIFFCKEGENDFGPSMKIDELYLERREKTIAFPD